MTVTPVPQRPSVNPSSRPHVASIAAGETSVLLPWREGLSECVVCDSYVH